jgi:hypothetical protein
MKRAIIAALFAVTALPAFAQYYPDGSFLPQERQEYDAYGRPLASIKDLCREGQMAGGPLTTQCMMRGYRFARNGEQYGKYDLFKWGYNLRDMAVTKRMADRLDNDPSYRAQYIKAHHAQKLTNELKDSLCPLPENTNLSVCVGHIKPKETVAPPPPPPTPAVNESPAQIESEAKRGGEAELIEKITTLKEEYKAKATGDAKTDKRLLAERNAKVADLAHSYGYVWDTASGKFYKEQ